MSDVASVESWLRGARAVAVITGAGISAESGMPTFRGADGFWRSFRPEDFATPQAFARSLFRPSHMFLVWRDASSRGGVVRADVVLRGPSGTVLSAIEAAL